MCTYIGEQGIAAFFKHHTCGHMCKGFMNDRPAFKYKRWPKKTNDTTDEQDFQNQPNQSSPVVNITPYVAPDKRSGEDSKRE